MGVRVGLGACGFALLMFVGRAASAHPPGVDDEGTPDVQTRNPALERPSFPNPAAGPDPHELPPPPVQPPRTLPYYEWSRIPHGYDLKMGSVRKGLVLGGALTLSIGHVAALFSSLGVGVGCTSTEFIPPRPVGGGSTSSANAACASAGTHAGELAIPVVGPFVAFAEQGKGEPLALYPVLGVVEVIGFGMLLVGATIDDKRLVRSDGPHASLTSGPGQAGLGMRLSF